MDAINQPLLDVRDLSVAFHQPSGISVAVDRISFEIKPGECVALVGESGSGKSVSALSILKLLPYPTASHPSGQIRFKGRELLNMSEREIRGIRGNDISIIFQEPMTSLNPLHTIESQIGEILQLHSGVRGAMARARTLELLTQVGIPEPERRYRAYPHELSGGMRQRVCIAIALSAEPRLILQLHSGIRGSAARARTLELLSQVGIPEPETRLASYPHQLSGGQRQRVMIAMALANEPDLLIADEPTTALDVTVQAQILTLLAEIRARLGMSLLFITHDLGIVRRIADVVCVMNNGKIVEQGPVEQVFTAPKHPYTKALLAAEPKPDPAPPRPDSPVVMSTNDLKVWFPVKRGLLPPRHADRVSRPVRRAQPAHVGRRHRCRRSQRASACIVRESARSTRDQGADGRWPRSGDAFQISA